MASARLDTDGGALFDPDEAASLIEAGRADEVAQRCQSLIARDRGGALTRATLARALIALARPNEAVVAAREASFLWPNVAEIALVLGEALAASDALPTAIAEFQRAARLAPEDGRPHWHVARLWLTVGEPEKAEAAAEVAEALGGASADATADLRESAARMRAAPRSDAGYVRHLFDQFAADYDARMRGRLGYAAPTILRGLAELLVRPSGQCEVLDLGCGTGLSGLAFKPFARRLVGVDLSPLMLEKARALQIYDALVEGDVETLPASIEGAFDMVITADVLVYLGDLDAVFGTAASRVRADGLWLFTTERGEGLDFERGPKRRWRHRESYLRRLADGHGFEAASLIECVTRYEAGEPVGSWAAAFRKR